jgi:hypothetical protein
MRNKSRVLWATIVLLLFGVFCWRALREGEPAYAGKSLSTWMDIYYSRSTRTKWPNEEAAKAIRQIGTNGIPTLLRMVRAKDSYFRQKAARLLEKQSVVSVKLQSADHYHAMSSWGFSALGSIARPAVPALIDLLKDKDPTVRGVAAQALACIGPEAKEAVPALVESLRERNNGILQGNAMMALGNIHTNAELVVPVLMDYLDGPRKEWNYAISAMHALSLYGRDATSAVPALKKLVNDPDSNTKTAAENALWRINHD